MRIRPARFVPLPSWTRALAAVALLACTGSDESRERRTPQAQDAPPAQQDRASADTSGAIILATTTSTYDTGLLDSLVPMFRAQTGIGVKVISVGTGAALEMAGRGNADAVLVHAPESERKYIASGDLVGSRFIMHNDFLLVGPPGDPAKVRGRRELAAAMQAIARTGPFISRGDGSGTERMELELWEAAGVDPKAVTKREATGQGMAATLNVADQRQAYTLTDRATYLFLKDRLSLVPVFENDPRLLNIYHAYAVNAGKHPRVKQEQGEAFVAFLAAPETQRFIGNFGRVKYGQSLFVADAGKDTSELHRQFAKKVDGG
jgi:tungstate transport system substrate-binding protein